MLELNILITKVSCFRKLVFSKGKLFRKKPN